MSAYQRNSGIYVMTPSCLTRGSLWGTHIIPYVMPPERSIDINDSFDMAVANFVLSSKLHLNGVHV
jgi:CMP-N-acetylneuraminic acid synthetase